MLDTSDFNLFLYFAIGNIFFPLEAREAKGKKQDPIALN